MSTQTYVNGVTLTDAAEFNLFDSVAYSVLSSVAGSTTLTATGPANYTYASTRPAVWLTPVSTNTGAVTLNVTPSGGAALGAKNVFWNGAACAGGELRVGVPTAVLYDGTQFHIVANGFRSPIVSTSMFTTSGTAKDFVGIPAYAKKLKVTLNGVSTTSTTQLILQVGNSSGPVSTGYFAMSCDIGGGPSHAFSAQGFIVNAAASTNVITGAFDLSLHDTSTWLMTGMFGDETTTTHPIVCQGRRAITGLDRVRLTTVGGVETFDAGTWNVLYE